MNTVVDPKKFGLPARTEIEQISNKHFALVISRKSRVIMSDGRKILEKAKRIIDVHPQSKVSLKISAPLCSKTKKFLEDNKIEIL